MQDFSLAFGRVTRSTMAANPELKTHVTDLLNRAYTNLHATPLTNADPQWVASITGAALQLSFDMRVQTMSVREIIQLFENIIIISEEHLREARRHAAMASNVFYLKETSLDALLNVPEKEIFHSASTKVMGHHKAHTGRLEVEKPGEPLV
jgi:hypothetical protein